MRIMSVGLSPASRSVSGVTNPTGGLFTRSLSGCSYVAMFRPALPFRRAMIALGVPGTRLDQPCVPRDRGAGRCPCAPR